MMKPNLEFLAKNLCMGTAMLVLSVLSVNPFTLIYSIFVLVSVRSTVDIWKEWRPLMFVFYIFDLLVTTAWTCFLTVYFVIPYIIDKNMPYVFYVTVFVDIVSMISLWLIVSTFTLFNKLYVDPHGEPIPTSYAGEHLMANEQPSK